MKFKKYIWTIILVVIAVGLTSIISSGLNYIDELEEQIIEKKPVIVEEPVDKLKTIGELIEEDDLELNIPDIEETNELNSINDYELEDNNIDDVLKEPTTTEKVEQIGRTISNGIRRK